MIPNQSLARFRQQTGRVLSAEAGPWPLFFATKTHTHTHTLKAHVPCFPWTITKHESCFASPALALAFRVLGFHLLLLALLLHGLHPLGDSHALGALAALGALGELLLEPP